VIERLIVTVACNEISAWSAAKAADSPQTTDFMDSFVGLAMHASANSTSDEAAMTNAVHLTTYQRSLLYAFIVFSLCAFVVAIAIFVSSNIAERLLPYYGWPIIGLFYLGALKYAIPPLFERNPIPITIYVGGISRTLWVIVCYGVVTAIFGWMTDDFGNPWLTVNVVQPIWTVLVPLAWIALFRSSENSATEESAAISGGS
jgi:hypothetical protein